MDHHCTGTIHDALRVHIPGNVSSPCNWSGRPFAVRRSEIFKRNKKVESGAATFLGPVWLRVIKGYIEVGLGLPTPVPSPH